MSTTIIVGGVAGGMSTATRLRRLDEAATIIVLERGADVSFANCGLPYHLSDAIPDRAALVLQTPAGLGARFGIDVRVLSEVVAIDRATKTVAVLDLITGETATEAYDTLVLSPGAAPIRPAIPGGERAHVLRDLTDLDRIVSAQGDAATAVVLGGGFIGLEVAENLARRGLGVAVVQRGEHLLPTLDPEMAAPIAERMRDEGLEVILGLEAAVIDDRGVILSDGTRLPADLVIAAIGVRPETALAEAAGLTLGRSGGIAVDELHRTSDPSIYAIGDAAEKTDAVGGHRLVALAGLANRHGRSVADAIAGVAAPARPALGTAIVSVTGIIAASVGWTERALRAAGRELRVIHTHPAHHVGYYPGAETMAIKLMVDPETDRMLGAQIVGTAGVDKRIDVLATAMSAGLTASALADLELAYAPQFGAAKDPINMLGYIARNQAAGADATLQWHELGDAIAAGATLLDVRAESQRAEGGIPGATHLTVEAIRDGHPLPDGPLIVHCRVGQGAHTAQRLLAARGHEVRNLDGGYLTWRAGRAATARMNSSTFRTHDLEVTR